MGCRSWPAGVHGPGEAQLFGCEKLLSGLLRFCWCCLGFWVSFYCDNFTVNMVGMTWCADYLLLLCVLTSVGFIL